jgi:phosphatidylglycerophosphate synthase
MPAYQPTSRRPIAAAFRATAGRTVRFCVRRRVHPDTISYLSIVAAAAAATCFWQSSRHPWLLLLAPAFCYLRLWCNMLDGMVALASGQASLRGEILNEVPDRISDVLIFVGVAHSGLGATLPGYWAAILALFTAYIGMFGQAVGVQREFGGVMTKPWRMVTLHLGAWVALGLHHFTHRPLATCYAGLTVLDWTCLVVIAGCLQTVALRLSRILRALARKTAAPPPAS